MAKVANTKMSAEIAGIVCPVDFAGMADDPARVQYVIDLLSSESPDGADLQARQYMDQMTRLCRASMVVMLTKLKAAVS